MTDWAGVWLRVNGPAQSDGHRGTEPKLLAFDNMQDRPIKGTFDWKRIEIVLDVRPEATEIAFGILLSKDGQVWIDDLKFEVVPESVPITGREGRTPPSNLDFEK